MMNPTDTIWCLVDPNDEEMLRDPLEEKEYGFQDTDPTFHQTLSLKDNKCVTPIIIKQILDRSVDPQDTTDTPFIYITDKLGRGIEIPVSAEDVSNSKSALLERVVQGYNKDVLVVTDVFVMRDILSRICKGDKTADTLETEYGLEYFKCLTQLEIQYDISRLVRKTLNFFEYNTMLDILDLLDISQESDETSLLLQPRNTILRTILSHISFPKIDTWYLPEIKQLVSRHIAILYNRDTVSVWDIHEKKVVVSHKSESKEYGAYYAVDNYQLPSGLYTNNVTVAKIYPRKIAVVILDLITGVILAEQLFHTESVNDLSARTDQDTLVSISKSLGTRVIGLNKSFLVTCEKKSGNSVFRIYHRKRNICNGYTTDTVVNHEPAVHFVSYTLDVLAIHFNPSKIALVYFPPDSDTSQIRIMDFTLENYDANVFCISCSQGGRFVAVSVMYQKQIKRGERASTVAKSRIWRTIIFDVVRKKRVCLNLEAIVPVGVTHCWDPKTARTDQHLFSTTFSYSPVYPANKICVVQRVFTIGDLLVYSDDMYKPMTLSATSFVFAKLRENKPNMLSFISRSRYLVPISSQFTNSVFKRPGSISVLFKNSVIICFTRDEEGKIRHEVMSRFAPGLEDDVSGLTAFNSFALSTTVSSNPY